MLPLLVSEEDLKRGEEFAELHLAELPHGKEDQRGRDLYLKIGPFAAVIAVVALVAVWA